MIYNLRHLTTYTYGSIVSFSHCALRLLPRNGPGQYVYESKLIIEPTPAQIRERTCFFQNRISVLTIETPHRELRVEALSTVEIKRDPVPMAALSPSWEVIREASFNISSMQFDSPAHFIHPSRFVPRFDPATLYARQSFTPGRPVLEAAIDLMGRIRREFKYDPKATVVSTPLAQAFEQRSGVCQDFAHIMIAGLRGLGLPASYISGYIRTIPPEGQPRLEGADATHAWVSLWCGAQWGWVGLDPTNDILIGDDHIILAVGRDYDDISPVDGIILSSGDQKIEVEVDVIPVLK